MAKPTLTMALAGLLGSAVLAQGPAPALVVAHAGSLSAALKAVEELYTRQTGVPVQDLAGGSVGLARRLAAGRLRCDLFAAADSEVIDRMLEPAGLSGPALRFARGAMVLVYATTSRNAATIAAPGPFRPPEAVPAAAPDWYAQLAQPGVRIAGAHPFLDPGGYRADLIFQLAQDQYQTPDLYNDLLSNYVVTGGGGGLGRSFDYLFSYQHGAEAAARADTTGTYRYVRLPDAVNLGVPALDARYARRSITLPGLQVPGAAATVTIPASTVTWGITLMNDAPHRDQAVAFLRLLLGDSGGERLRALGPAPIQPAEVSARGYGRLPADLKALVRVP
jgi:molybdate/tungstate transport system substrate-binding protein